MESDGGSQNVTKILPIDVSEKKLFTRTDSLKTHTVSHCALAANSISAKSKGFDYHQQGQSRRVRRERVHFGHESACTFHFSREEGHSTHSLSDDIHT